eukprot:gene20071-22814_t
MAIDEVHFKMGDSTEAEERHAVFMRAAIAQAEMALNGGEIPVGCVFVNNETGTIVATGHNETNETRNAIAKVGVKTVYFGCHNDRFGGNGSILPIHNDVKYTPVELQYEVFTGMMKDEAIEVFQRFYESENRRAPEAKRRKKG